MFEELQFTTNGFGWGKKKRHMIYHVNVESK